MSKYIIWQLWKKYKETKDVYLLHQAIDYADMSDDFGFDATELKEEIKRRLGYPKTGATSREARNFAIVEFHKHNKAEGMSISESYENIQKKFGMTSDAVRKVIEASETKKINKAIIQEYEENTLRRMPFDENINKLAKKNGMTTDAVRKVIEAGENQ